MAGLVSHATLRGVRIVPEFDSPAHCAQGWQFGEAEAGLGKLVLCERQSEDRCKENLLLKFRMQCFLHKLK